MNVESSWTVLQKASAAVRTRLVQVGRAVEFPVGSRIISAGDPATAITIITSGVIRVFHAREPDVQFTVKLLSAPDSAGLVEVLRNVPWVASIEPLTPVSGFVIPAEEVRRALAADPGITAAVLDDLAAKFEGTMRVTQHLGFDRCEVRLIRVLLEYSEHLGRPTALGLEIRAALTRERLAREIGAVRRSVDRALAELRKLGLVETSPKGWLVLPRPDDLRDRLRRETSALSV